DLSEYNILYDSGVLYIIDVSQSVEHDHPNALHFLRKDCTNVTDFFRKHHVPVMLVRELFDFITDPTLPAVHNEQVDSRLLEIQRKIAERDNEHLFSLASTQVSEQVFMNAFIPRKLDDAVHVERDMEKINAGDTEDMFYSHIAS